MRAAAIAETAVHADGLTDAAALGVADGLGAGGPTAGWLGLEKNSAPPIASTPITAAAARRKGIVMVGNLHGTRKARR